MRKKQIGCLLAATMLATTILSGCGSNVVQQAESQSAAAAETTAAATTAAAAGEAAGEAETEAEAYAPDLSETVNLKVNFSVGNKSRTMTYNQESPLNLPDGTVVTAGMLKPMWSEVERVMNVKFSDVAVQDMKSSDMIQTESTTNFSGANLFGGESVAESLMYYGTEGKFVNLSEKMAEGYLPNFKAYLDKNPAVKSAITAYDGGIYHVPYIAEIGTFARTFNVRAAWVPMLLDVEDADYDTDNFTVYYDGYYIGDNARVGANGGTVTPKDGISITKKTGESIIEIQNALDVKNGETLTKAMIQYIKDNYDYENPSELFLDEKAAYDIDELIALWRCIKANPHYLTDGKADVVWPMFQRQSSYREDYLRFGIYWGTNKAHCSDSYQARWYIDENGDVQYSYSEEGMYDVLNYLADLNAEGLIYADSWDLNVKTNFRSALWGTDDSDAPEYGFMTFDFTASSTADSLNTGIRVVLPPVAPVNGVWQYHIANGRAIKPDGWAVSVAGNADEAELERTLAVVDYFFTEEGAKLQNYGIPMALEEGGVFHGPDGKDYPKYAAWLNETCNEAANGDLSIFLRDWMGSLMPIGYAKEIGFEYQYTSQNGFDGWELLQNSTTTIDTYAGEGVPGDNPNFYKMIPPVFSLTSRQNEAIADSTSIATDDIVEYMFNIVRYKTLGNAPQGTEVAQSYDEYLNKFKEKGLDLYEETYQTAYQVMTQGQ